MALTSYRIADDMYDDEDIICDVFKHPVATEQWGQIRVSHYFANTREIIPYMDIWKFNRKVNEEHKNKIKTALLSQTTPHLMGTIQVVRDRSGRCRVLNGQHRLIAAREVISEDIDMKFQMKMMITIYTNETLK